MRTQKLPETVVNRMTPPAWAILSLATPKEHWVPFQLPIHRPTTRVVSTGSWHVGSEGSRRQVSDAVIEPDAVAANGNVAMPFGPSVPMNVSVAATPEVGVGDAIVVSSLPQPSATSEARAEAATRAAAS